MVKRSVKRNLSRKSKVSRKVGGKRKINAYFKAMLHAKKNKSASFKYKNKTYVGVKHKHLGMIYKAQ
jgi:hypothetical protein